MKTESSLIQTKMPKKMTLTLKRTLLVLFGMVLGCLNLGGVSGQMSKMHLQLENFNDWNLPFSYTMTILSGSAT